MPSGRPEPEIPYRLERLLGRGAAGEVWQASGRASGNRVAVKCIDLGALTAKERHQASQEAYLLRRVKHPHIVRFFDCIVGAQQMHIVMQLMEGGDLASVIRRCRDGGQRPPEASIWRWLLQMARALAYLHKISILHRDVKPANIFLSEDERTAVLGDLGIAKVALAGAWTQIGTPGYLAPEVWLGQKYDFAADIYSLGCTIFEATMLRRPFAAEGRSELAAQVCFRRSPAPDAGEPLRTLVQRMLCRTPCRRPGAQWIVGYARQFLGSAPSEDPEPRNVTRSCRELEVCLKQPIQPSIRGMASRQPDT